MKKLGSVILVVFICTACGALEDATSGDSNSETAGSDALDSSGTVYASSFDDASSTASALIQAIALGEISPKVKALTFDGSTTGSSGTASWSGTITDVTNLDLNYTMTFSNYKKSASQATIDGLFSIAVSRTSTACSGTWNIDDLSAATSSGTFTIDSTGTGLTLDGAACKTMNLSGLLDITKDSTVRCTVGGTVSNPSVSC